MRSRWPVRTFEERFWAYVDKSGDCWEWAAYRDKHGYGRFEHALSHRLAWTFAKGPIPVGMFVCHRCDNPPCVNPAHLFIGTQTDNMQDAKAKGRTKNPRYTGEAHPNRKLTWAAVDAIREAASQGVSHHALARRFGVSRPLIDGVVRERWWLPSDRPVVEAPGRGRKPRKLAVLEWADWLALHGPTGGTE